ncbi:MAG: type II secretion system F family protein [Phycisphaerae bacterium]
MSTLGFVPMLAMGPGDMLLWILLGAGPLLVTYGVLQLVADLKGASKKRLKERLKGHAAPGRSATATLSVEELRKTVKVGEGALAKSFARLNVTQKLQAMLDQANIPWVASTLLVNLTAGASITLAVLMLVKISFLNAFGIALAVFFLPLLWLMRKRKSRINKLVQQLPDVFELLSQALRAGHSLASGMQLIANELPEPAGTEFGRVFHEQNLGVRIEDALTNLANRMDVLDVRFFVTAVLIQRQTGGDLAEVLDRISGVIRERIKLFGTVQALTAEGRLSGYVLLALPVVCYLAMLKINYEYAMTLFTHPTGQMMATFALVMQLMGWVMIKKIINIKV